MLTKMDGITQPSLFSGTLRLDIVVSEEDRYRVLSEELPWLKLADVSNHYRSKVVGTALERNMFYRFDSGIRF